MRGLIVKVLLSMGCEDEQEAELPGKHAVCWDCEGHGTTLAPGIREHAYTMEEFCEAFDDDEDRAEYFRHGGRYDVSCETCKGARVTVEVDRDACTTPELTKLLEEYDRQQEEEAAYQRECAAERAMGA